MTTMSSRDTGAEALRPSPEQQRILALLAQGYSSDEIAQTLHYSGRASVTRHLSRLKERLGLPRMEQLYVYAGQAGWASVQPVTRGAWK